MSLKKAEAALMEAIRILSEARSQIRTGQVKAVDQDNLTCDVFDELRGITYHDVRIRPIVGGDGGIYGIPSIESNAVLGMLNNKEEATIMLFADSYNAFVVNIGTQTMVISEDGIEFNGGDNGGLVKISDLVTKLNNIENYINDTIFVAYNAHTHTTPSGPSGVPQSLLTDTLTPTQISDLEDDLITH